MKKFLLLFVVLTMLFTVAIGFGSCGIIKDLLNMEDDPVPEDPTPDDPTPEDPSPKYTFVEGSFGVKAAVTEGYTVIVETVSLSSEEYDAAVNTLKADEVDLDGRAWVMYNVSVQKKSRSADEDPEKGAVEVPAPISDVKEYEVYEITDTEAKETQCTLEDGYIAIAEWNYSSTYLIVTEQPFNVVEYYATHEEGTIPEHLNVGSDTAEDAYQKGQTRTLNVYAYTDFEGGITDENFVYVNGLPLNTYNQDAEEHAYKSINHLSAYSRVPSHPDLVFAGWYLGQITEGGEIILEDTPYFTERELMFEMPAQDITIFAVYSEKFNFHVAASNGMVSVDGGEFSSSVFVHGCFDRTFTLSATPSANCYFSHWAYANDRNTAISTELTFTYTAENADLDVVAVCVPYEQYTFTVSAAHSSNADLDDEFDYGFLINGEENLGYTYTATVLEYQQITVTALPKMNCKFIGWYLGDKPDNIDALLYDYTTLMDGIIRTEDPNYVLKGSEYDNKILIAIYEVLPQYNFSAECYFINDEYGSYASIHVNGHYRGDNCYYGRLSEGFSVTVKAVPEMNCFFDGWYYITIDEYGNPVFGDLASADAEFTFTMGTSDVLVYAKMRCYPTYSVSAYAGDGADIYINGENHYGDVRLSYEEGDVLKFSVDVKDGFEFKGWYRNDGVTEVLVSTDPEFEFTVGNSDASFLAHVEPIIYHDVMLEIMGPSITVDLAEFEGLTYIPVEEIYRVYVIMRREGSVVTLKAHDVEGAGQEFAYWDINGQIVAEREYTFTVGTEDVAIRAYCRDRAYGIKMTANSGDSDVRAIYSTDYATGEKYISGISVPMGTQLCRVSKNVLFEALEFYYVRIDGVEIRYDDISAQCDIDFGGAIEYNNTDCIFATPGRYTITVTDKLNPELKITFTVQIVGYDPTGTYVWVSRTGAKYHINPYCSNMQTVTIMTVEEAIAAGYEPCKVCAYDHDE